MTAELCWITSWIECFELQLSVCYFIDVLGGGGGEYDHSEYCNTFQHQQYSLQHGCEDELTFLQGCIQMECISIDLAKSLERCKGN